MEIIKIVQCFNEGTIYSKAYYDFVGGFIGTMNRNLATDFQIIDSYVNATMKGICTNGYSQGGGLIGHITGDDFIRAEITPCNDFLELGSYNACKEKGVTRLEGKDYVMQDGDLAHFRFAL